MLTAASTAILTTAGSLAGTTYVPSKTVAPVHNPVFYGTGFYMGLEGGINAAQDLGDRHFSLRGNDVSLESDDNIGGVGGLKLGYVFGTGVVRPAIEADLYYNGFKIDVDGKVNGDTRFNANANVNSGAFLANFMLRFAFNRFQPDVGGGIGGYYASIDDIEVRARNRSVNGVEGGEGGGLAWQIVGGADYYCTEKFSVFAEYKYLNYEEPSADFTDDRLDQHLVVLGFRWHF